jgi:hypothetical protein
MARDTNTLPQCYIGYEIIAQRVVVTEALATPRVDSAKKLDELRVLMPSDRWRSPKWW